MAGYVFYNGFWNPDGPPEVVRSLTAAAAARGAKWVRCQHGGDGGIHR